MTTIYQMKLFIEIYDNKSIGKVSRSAFISHQAISKTIRDLESELGCKLFQRTHFGMEPNEYGQYVYQEFQKILKIVEAIPQRVKEMQHSVKEVLNVSFSYGVLGSLDASLLSNFSRLYPNIRINCNDVPDLVVEEELLSGKAEIGFVIEPVDRSKFDVWPLRSEPIYLIVHKDNPLYTKEAITTEDLRGQMLMNAGPQMKNHSAISEMCRKAGADIVYTINEFVVSEQKALTNQALMLVPISRLRSDVPMVRYIPLADPTIKWSYSLAICKGREITPGMAAFKEAVFSV